MSSCHGYGFCFVPGKTHSVRLARVISAIVLSLVAGSAAGRWDFQQGGIVVAIIIHNIRSGVIFTIKYSPCLSPPLGYEEDPAYHLYCICCAWTWAPQVSAYSYVQTLTTSIDRVLSLRQLRQDELLQLSKMEVIRVDNSCPLTAVS
jgi:hypothetical protein